MSQTLACLSLSHGEIVDNTLSIIVLATVELTVDIIYIYIGITSFIHVARFKNLCKIYSGLSCSVAPTFNTFLLWNLLPLFPNYWYFGDQHELQFYATLVVTSKLEMVLNCYELIILSKYYDKNCTTAHDQ